MLPVAGVVPRCVVVVCTGGIRAKGWVHGYLHRNYAYAITGTFEEVQGSTN